VYSDEQRRAAEASLERYQAALKQAGLPDISTEILDAPTFYYAETYQQQYLAKTLVVTAGWVAQVSAYLTPEVRDRLGRLRLVAPQLLTEPTE
jgi:peptide methionine sulfoxide reductase MsrA